MVADKIGKGAVSPPTPAAALPDFDMIDASICAMLSSWLISATTDGPSMPGADGVSFILMLLPSPARGVLAVEIGGSNATSEVSNTCNASRSCASSGHRGLPTDSSLGGILGGLGDAYKSSLGVFVGPPNRNTNLDPGPGDAAGAGDTW